MAAPVILSSHFESREREKHGGSDLSVVEDESGMATLVLLLSFL